MCDEIVLPIDSPESIRFLYTPDDPAHNVLADVVAALYDNTKLS